ncbi:MAG: bifunctional glutamate N-acetyltransferase/amino-acid acetyltransferase ArgJ, partial [Abditibacteriaceae bacterium]
DLFLLQSLTPAVAAGVFTRNQVIGAPVRICAEHLAQATVRAVISNSGNANCCTGEDGLEKARQMCAIAAEKVGCLPEEVLVCSTGIIGVPLALEKIMAQVPSMNWNSGAEADLQAAQAIMTTDLVPKYFSASDEINGKTVTLGGMVKGSGMIGPDMGALPHATMLAFLTTDAAVEKVLLQQLLESAVDQSFNSVTVDGDTSSNDTCLLLANGSSGAVINDQNKKQFAQLLQTVCTELAKKVAADGEGATHLIEIQIHGAASAKDAHKVAMTVANSPLVKTAIFGGDPNWGRLAVAAGRAGVPFDMAELSIRLGELEVLRNGEPVTFNEAKAAEQLKPFKVEISIEIGKGDYSWTAWTCDYSYDYIKINAEYHT